MSRLGLAELLFFLVLKTELHGCVPVLVLRFLLHDDAGPGLDDGDRNDSAVIIEDLRHADLFPDDRLFHTLSSLLRLLVDGQALRLIPPT